METSKVPAQVQHQHAAFAVTLLQAIGQRGGRGFIDQALDTDAGQLAGSPGGLALGIGEVGRHADHRFLHLVAQGGFGVGQQRTQHHRRELLGTEAALTQPGLTVAAHPALEMGHGLLRMADQAVTGRLADQHGAIDEADHRRSQQLAMGIGEQLRSRCRVHADEGMGGAKIDADDHLRTSDVQKTAILGVRRRPDYRALPDSAPRAMVPGCSVVPDCLMSPRKALPTALALA